jgi:hypothetical protein
MRILKGQRDLETWWDSAVPTIGSRLATRKGGEHLVKEVLLFEPVQDTSSADPQDRVQYVTVEIQ